MKRTMAILVVLAALAMPALAWADEQVPYNWSGGESTDIQQSRDSHSERTTAPQSEEGSELADQGTIVQPEPVAGDNA